MIEFNEEAGGEIHGEIKIESDRRVIVKRIDSGEELSEADLEVLLVEALGEHGLHDSDDVDVKVIVKKIVEDEETDSEE